MTMLTVSICVAALVSLAVAKIAADAARAKSCLAPAKSKRRTSRLPIVAFAVAASMAALGAAFTYTSA